jgi:hypothetical protein
MMPTFPSPPLKFRTVGFPQYGFKASMSDRACRPRGPVKRVPRIPRSPKTFTLPFAHGDHRPTHLAQRPGQGGLVGGRCLRGPASLPQGSLAPAGVVLSPALHAYYDPIRQSRRHAATSPSLQAYTPRRRCAGTPRQPARPSLLSLPHCPHVPSTLRRGSEPPSRYAVARCQASSASQKVATHKMPASASNARRGDVLGAASFALCCGPCVCLALQAGYDPVRPRVPHRAY